MQSTRPLIRWAASCLGLLVATVAGVVGLTASAANAAPASYGVSNEMVTFDDTTVEQGQFLTITLSATPPDGLTYRSLINSFTLFDTTKWTYLGCTVVSSPVPASCDMTPTDGDGTANTVTFEEDRLAPGQTAVIDYRIQVNRNASGLIAYSGELVNFGTYAGSLLVVETADLAVRLAADPHGLLVHSVTYTATVTNTGPSDANQVELRFTYPAGYVHPRAGGCDVDTGNRSVTCELGAIASGATVSRSVHLTVGLLTIGSDLTVTATRTASTPDDPNSGNDSDSASCAAVTTLLVSC